MSENHSKQSKNEPQDDPLSQPKQPAIIKAPRPTPNRPIRQQARPGGNKKQPQRSQLPEKRTRPKIPQNSLKNPRFIFWAKVILITFLVTSIGLTIRAMMNIDSNLKGNSWSDELRHGNIDRAAKKFFILTSDAVDQVFESDLSPETLIADFKAALPHLRKAGYVLTELEVEVGITPKLIPHFYHDPAIELDMDKTLAALEDNSIGTALMIALAQASKLQKTIEISDMQFNHIEVELGPIPSLKLQYKNDHAIKEYIHHE